MNLFPGFSHMGEYFMKTDTEKRNIEMEKNKLLDERDKFDQYITKEKQLLEFEKNQLAENLKQLKEKEAEMILMIDNKMIEHELSLTGKIQCHDHTHKSIKTYQQCGKNKNYVKPLKNMVYFVKEEITESRFDDKIKDFFELFPEKMKKTMNVKQRYDKYTLLFQKIIIIEDLCKNKQNYQDVDYESGNNNENEGENNNDNEGGNNNDESSIYDNESDS